MFLLRPRHPLRGSCGSDRLPLCISLSTFPAHACVRFTVYFPCACIYALRTALALRMPATHFTLCLPCACLFALPFTVYFPCACLYALSLRMPLCVSLSTFRLCSRSCGEVLRVLPLYIQSYDFDPCRRSCADREDMRGFTRDHSESDLTRATSAQIRARTAKIRTGP